jgi:hypothetical protein
MNVRLKPFMSRYLSILVDQAVWDWSQLARQRNGGSRGLASRNEEALHQLTKEIVGAERTSARMVVR